MYNYSSQFTSLLAYFKKKKSSFFLKHGLWYYKLQTFYKRFMIHQILKLSMESRQEYKLEEGLRSVKSLQILWECFSWTCSNGWILNNIQRNLVKPSFIPPLEEFPIALSMKIGLLSLSAGLQSLGCWCRTTEVITNHISWTLKMISQ